MSQSELFTPDQLPPRPDLVSMVKHKSFVHTGKLLSRDEELCRAVCVDAMSGTMSTRQLSAKYGISRNSIVGIMSAMDRRGELEPLKERTSSLLGTAVTLGLENLCDAYSSDKVPAGSLPIGLCALIDKKGQLDAGVVPGTQLRGPEVTVEDVERAFSSLRVANAVELESQSAGNEGKQP